MEDSDYINNLINALENENNEHIVSLNKCKIQKEKNDILQKLQVSREKLKDLHKKLKDYRYVSELTDIKEGAYIRWIPLKNPEHIKLTNGGIIVNTLIYESGIQIRIKNNMNRFIQFKLDEAAVFQKLTNQEKIILDVLNYLEKE
jgi:TPP-dependent trihydroxycyclohexane-1,2-dione (THcHDO) dehydratase